MSRKAALIGILGALFASIAPVAPASAGGGACHSPEATSSRTTVVLLSEACFMPTLARVPVGAEVRWVNKDPIIHTVTGAHNAWGSTKDLNPGDFITVSFSRPGVYPYYCLYHAGMAGAVLVGDANGAGAAAGGITAVPVSVPRDKTSSLKVASTQETSSWPLVALGVGLATGLAGFGVGRRRRNGITPEKSEFQR